MFNRENYSQRAVSTFEIIGSFIVDLFYNHFYQEAKKLRIDGRVDSVTDGYKHAVKSYLHSFQNPDSYRKTIVGIHKYYYTTTRFSTISFSECVNEIVKTNKRIFGNRSSSVSDGTYEEKPNVGAFMYDDGAGNLIGAGTGTINYETGAVDFTARVNAEFVVSATYLSAHSGGTNISTTNGKNHLTAVGARSTSQKLNSQVKVIALN